MITATCEQTKLGSLTQQARVHRESRFTPYLNPGLACCCEETMANPESRPQPPDGGWGWMVVLGGFIVGGCTIGTYRSLGVFFLTFSQQFHASSAETAWITSILIFVTAFLC
ncbi:hypothetical protein Bbelb_229690 [Branchiostoma belcheri]|nr:hypothetical protein Bbelb_229690 [Branchiostoma belcheri]